jgi:GT2 family glycosyltransferase
MDPHPLAPSLNPLAPLRRRRPPRSIRAVPHLSVVIVNYHQWDDVRALVGQLRASRSLRRGRAEILVVDNHSPPDPAASRLRRLEGVSLRRWRRNRGFARAVNEGCRLSRGGWMLLLNPDVSLAPGFVEQALHLTERLDREQPHVGIVGLGLRDSDGARQLSSGPFPTLLSTLSGLLWPRGRRKYGIPPGDRHSPVDWVTGCGLLVRRECWRQLGGFDPSFFLYYEDVDLCRRAREQGWQVLYEPALSLVHHHPLHTRKVPPALRLVTRHALLTYAHKHWAKWQFRALAWVVRLEAWWRRRAATLRGDAGAADAFAALDRVSAALVADRPETAARRLLGAVRREEERRGSLSVGSRPQF